MRAAVLRTAGVLASVVGLTVAGVAAATPSQAVQKCSTTKYATWGAASICKDGATVRVQTLDRVEDGYCVQLWVGAKFGNGEPWGMYFVAENCGKNTWKTTTKTLTNGKVPLYACNAYLWRGTVGQWYRYLPVWRELEGVPVADNCSAP